MHAAMINTGNIYYIILVYVTSHLHKQDCLSWPLFAKKVEPLHKHHTFASPHSPQFQAAKHTPTRFRGGWNRG